jgi:hypothetical protein
MTRIEELDRRIATLRENRRHMLAAQRWWARLRRVMPEPMWARGTLRIYDILAEMADVEEHLKAEAHAIRTVARAIGGALWN